jgi:hypothetical protein
MFGASSGITDWGSRIELDGKVSGVYADYHYIGTGDIGGAPDEESVKFLEALATQETIVLPPANDPSGSHATKASSDYANGDGVVRA